MIKRELLPIIKDKLFKQKAIIIIGARQVGKTTLLQDILSSQEGVMWFNGDDLATRDLFNQVSKEKLMTIFGSNKIIIIYEAQRIKDIGLKAKIITDQMKDIQLILTGSSSFELSNNINEPLTGRKWEYNLYPISFSEMVNDKDLFNEIKQIEQRMIFGYYPEVVCNPNSAMELLKQLANSYLYKDILQWERIKKPDMIVHLLQALAYQVGSQVSLNELSRLVGLDRQTVDNYISILEKAQIIFRLSSFSRNLRTELRNSKKIYFFDNGIRNSLINNFAPLDSRTDTGALWENFLISERIILNAYTQSYCNKYFWRTTQQQEIDYLEEKDGVLSAYEFKWSETKKAKPSRSFSNAYPNTIVKTITKDNFYEFLLAQR